MSVVVFGSVNMDLIVRAARLPRPGETITGEQFFTAPGGKGANQAVASARLGALTRMIGRVGGDVFGATLRDNLVADGIDVDGLLTDAEQSSGVALITVEEGGENTIVVVPGANGALSDPDVERLTSALSGARVLLLQLEVPMEAVVAAAQAARERGVSVIVDPAPVRPLPPELYGLADLLTPNESEAALLVGFELATQTDVERAARTLLERGARGVVIKLGARGAYWTDGESELRLAPFAVKAVDTVAAGDAFNGGVAAGLAEGLDMAQALRWGMAAGALSVTKAGAQPSLPRRDEVLRLLQSGSATA